MNSRTHISFPFQFVVIKTQLVEAKGQGHRVRAVFIEPRYAKLLHSMLLWQQIGEPPKALDPRYRGHSSEIKIDTRQSAIRIERHN
ncbi:hypothetical protein C8R43DRAFT_207467 [Mycena crocata]|nr:hypothetical protein C8R43DRAFT_207467 [Mycena crocata]